METINVISGNDIKIRIKLRDPTQGNILVTGASVYLKISGKKYKFKELSLGIYEYRYSPDNNEGIMTTKTIAGKIIITKANYLEEEIEIVIRIDLEEISPGIPTFYLINIIEAVGFIISIFIGYSLILKKHNKTILEVIKSKIRRSMEK